MNGAERVFTNRFRACCLIVGGGLALSYAGIALAERYVVVNGQRQTHEQILALERAHCGPVPNGHYWLNYRNGIWGYAGNPRPQGHIADHCRNPNRRPGLSERGMLFSPHDYVRRGRRHNLRRFQRMRWRPHG